MPHRVNRAYVQHGCNRHFDRCCCTLIGLGIGDTKGQCCCRDANIQVENGILWGYLEVAESGLVIDGYVGDGLRDMQKVT